MLEHVPELGPADVPLRHELDAPHQPQPAAAAQLEHDVFEAQGSVVVEHCPEVQRHALHVPTEGPFAVPLRQVLVVLQKPQPAAAVQPPHVEFEAQGSLALHELCTQLQFEQLPLVGPVEVPERHEFDEPHQPQPAAAVQLEHDEFDVQGSVVVVPPEHELCTQRQLLHELPVGPVEVPERHEESSLQKPQPAAAVHELQVLFESHGSVTVPPPHWPLVHAQLEQLPDVGPVPVPVMQVLVPLQ